MLWKKKIPLRYFDSQRDMDDGDNFFGRNNSISSCAMELSRFCHCKMRLLKVVYNVT